MSKACKVGFFSLSISYLLPSLRWDGYKVGRGHTWDSCFKLIKGYSTPLEFVRSKKEGETILDTGSLPFKFNVCSWSKWFCKWFSDTLHFLLFLKKKEIGIHMHILLKVVLHLNSSFVKTNLAISQNYLPINKVKDFLRIHYDAIEELLIICRIKSLYQCEFLPIMYWQEGRVSTEHQCWSLSPK